MELRNTRASLRSHPAWACPLAAPPPTEDTRSGHHRSAQMSTVCRAAFPSCSAPAQLRANTGDSGQGKEVGASAIPQPTRCGYHRRWWTLGPGPPRPGAPAGLEDEDPILGAWRPNQTSGDCPLHRRRCTDTTVPCKTGTPVTRGARQHTNTVLLKCQSSLHQLVNSRPLACHRPAAQPSRLAARWMAGTCVLQQLCLARCHMLSQSPLGAQRLLQPMGKLRLRHRVTPRRRGPA